MKISRRAACIMLVLSMAFVLTSCDRDIEGSWKFTGGSVLSEIGDISALGLEIIYTFNDDDTLEISTNATGTTRTMTGVWETDGDELIIRVDGDASYATWAVDGDTLTLTVADPETDSAISGASIELTRID